MPVDRGGGWIGCWRSRRDTGHGRLPFLAWPPSCPCQARASRGERSIVGDGLSTITCAAGVGLYMDQEKPARAMRAWPARARRPRPARTPA
ncbi:hypothetical protein ANDO1_3520 [plant metagenome]|uniref:Uncharacterized protein n=1 Tax=plant metagenome TaxID=1297885 RepID=A0A484PHU9_9ZZZZ